MSDYDYLIAGSGAAGLSLAVHIISSPALKDRRILLVDRDRKSQNDRTWCFWEQEAGLFQSIVRHEWQKAWIHGPTRSRLLDLHPYTYKQIRGIDFYDHCRERLAHCKNVEFITGEVSGLEAGKESAWCFVDGQKKEAAYLFSSLYQKPALKPKDHYLLQHFAGWRIRTSSPCFNPGEAVLMDFRIQQDPGASFVYLLPDSEQEALVEYTVFSGTQLPDPVYQESLRSYLESFYPGQSYEILEKEQGLIPMTDHRFPTHRGRIIYIGTAGGWTKPSTGYTFSFVQKHCRSIVASLASNGSPYAGLPRFSRRFHFYDRTLLEILEKGKPPGAEVFEKLFMNNNPKKILRFLDNETRLSEEIPLLLTLPIFPFAKAALKVNL